MNLPKVYCCDFANLKFHHSPNIRSANIFFLHGILLTTTESNKISSAVATERGCKKDGNVEDVGALQLALLGRDKKFDTSLSLDCYLSVSVAVLALFQLLGYHNSRLFGLISCRQRPKGDNNYRDNYSI